MKITRKQLRKIISEAVSADRIYLDDYTSDIFDLTYDNRGQEWIIYPEDFGKLSRMTQYDTKHQKIFAKYADRPSTTATGAGYGWWELA